MITIFTSMVRLYQRCISPFFPRTCRYAPTCSQYALEALNEHGIVKGCILSFWRILRCNPFFDGGFDPVPSKHHMHAVMRSTRGDFHE